MLKTNVVRTFIFHASVGWVRFKINQFITNASVSTTSAAESSSGNADWTTAFYLTRVDKIRAILDQGQPLPIGKFRTKIDSQTFFHSKIQNSRHL